MINVGIIVGSTRPEYNHGRSGALKNALDFLFAEWNNKAAGFVGYGSAGGARAVENLRLVMVKLKVADVPHERSVSAMLDEVVAWGHALKPLRAQQ